MGNSAIRSAAAVALLFVLITGCAGAFGGTVPLTPEEEQQQREYMARPTPPPQQTYVSNPQPQMVVTPACPVGPDGMLQCEGVQPAQVYQAPPPSSGGTVRVRGYTRRDGTYVRPYTRRR